MRVEVLKATQNPYTGDVITTFLLSGFPWRLLCELNTHRQVTKNTESSRARPVESVIDQVMTEPYVPVWTETQKGMQGQTITGQLADDLTYKWLTHRDKAVELAREAVVMGLHKQDANSYLHPWMRVSVICTATEAEWEHVFELRTDSAAKKCFQLWALAMQEEFKQAPIVVSDRHLVYGDDIPMMAQCAKIASVSYAKHTDERTPEEWLNLANTLINSKPVHISPFQHTCFAVDEQSCVEVYDNRMFALDYHNTTCLRHWCDLDKKSDVRVVSTANYRGWVSVANLIESYPDKSEIIASLMSDTSVIKSK